MSCTFYRWNGGAFLGDYWCDKKDCRVDSDTYYKYCRDYNFSACPIYKQTESSPGCFITTVTCEILGLSDDNLFLNILRGFRNQFLQKNEEHTDILKFYDVMGPMIAECLRNDKNNKGIANDIYENYIIPICCSIIGCQFDKAISRYETLTLNLIKQYNLTDEYNRLKQIDYDYKDFDIKTAGHGKRRIKQLSLDEVKSTP